MSGAGAAALDDRSLADLRARRRALSDAVAAYVMDCNEAKLALRVQVRRGGIYIALWAMVRGLV